MAACGFSKDLFFFFLWYQSFIFKLILFRPSVLHMLNTVKRVFCFSILNQLERLAANYVGFSVCHIIIRGDQLRIFSPC